ncbi:head-tail adaptor protein [Enterobacterales bacterium CwR94]|nr:head-tail adaptor protein [Enterobacterales bacterium CwR94]
MQAGKLRHWVTLQRPEKVQDPKTGAISNSWVIVDEMWADVVPLSAREFVAAQAVQSSVTTRITIRQRDDISSKCRIIHDGRVFNVEGVLADPKSGREYQTLPCSEGVNDG